MHALKNRLAAIMIIIAICSLGAGCTKVQASPVDYSDADMWAFSSQAVMQADLFIVAPTVYYGDETSYNMPIDDAKNRERIVGALNMQLGIYSGCLNVFSPYYRQASLSSVKAGTYLNASGIAYTDIAKAFEYYISNLNNGRAFVLAGFSQGAEMCLLLMKDYPAYLKNMIACYMNGWPITTDDLQNNPQIVPATGESDTGVVVCFNSEAPKADDTFTLPKGTKSVCINPLNWKTDGTYADKTLNGGACFTGYDGGIKTEIEHFTGAYIDETRGALKLPDVNAQDYPPGLEFLHSGEYHLYEYQFFYRNLQANVKTRVQSWFSK